MTTAIQEIQGTVGEDLKEVDSLDSLTTDLPSENVDNGYVLDDEARVVELQVSSAAPLDLSVFADCPHLWRLRVFDCEISDLNPLRTGCATCA